MADVTITGLPNAATLTGTERVPMDQGGATVDAPASAIAALATKATVGLGNADNTSDASKPISAATQTALDGKAPTGPIGSSGLTMTAGILGRESGTGAPQVFTLGSGLAIVGGALVVTGGGGGGYPSLSMPTGFSVSGSGTASLGVTFAIGYSLPLDSSQANWNTAFSERLRWDGSSTGLNAATARTSLGLGSAATAASSDFATAAQGSLAATAVQPATAAANYQPLDSDLTSIAALTTAAFGRSLLTQADAAAARTALGAGTVTGVTATGPITSSGGSVPVISTSMATSRLLGRSSAGAGVAEEISLGANLTLSGGVLSASATAVGSITGLGAGVATALSANVGSIGAPVVLNGAGGTPSSITLTSGTDLPLTTGVTGLLPVANGGTGTAAPGLVPGTNVTISGSWPNQTISASGGGGGGSNNSYAIGRYFTPFDGRGVAGSANTANTISFVPFTVKRGGTVTEIYARVNTVLAGSSFQLAVYAMGANGDPTGPPIGATASMSSAAVAGVADTLATAFDLAANTPYFLAVNVNSGTSIAFIALAGENFYPWTVCGPSSITGFNPGVGNTCFNYTLSHTFGTWPNVTGATFGTVFGNSRVPVALFKYGAFA
jgi:hypothetical protein